MSTTGGLSRCIVFFQSTNEGDVPSLRGRSVWPEDSLWNYVVVASKKNGISYMDNRPTASRGARISACVSSMDTVDECIRVDAVHGAGAPMDTVVVVADSTQLHMHRGCGSLAAAALTSVRGLLELFLHGQYVLPLVSVFTGLYIAVKSFITVVVLTQHVYCVAVLPCFMFQEPRALFLFRKRSDTFTNTVYILGQ